MSCGKNPYAPYAGCAQPCCTTLCPCGPTGPTGPANLSGTTSVAVGYFSTTPAAVTAAAATIIPFNVYTASSSPSYLIGTGAYQAPSTGLYVISPTVGYAFTTAGTITTSLMQNGVSRLQTSTTVSIVSDASTSFSIILLLNAGDIVQVQSQAVGAAAATLLSGTYPSGQTSLSILPLS